MVVDNQHPLGIIYTAKLDLYLSSLAKTQKQRCLRSQLQDNLHLLESLELISADWNLQQFNLYLQQNNPTNEKWAVVDNLGKYLGLVNNSYLLQYLASSPLENSSVAQVALDFLIDIVEKLPWAVVLQTNKGEVIAQSVNWQEHFGLWRDSVAVRV